MPASGLALALRVASLNMCADEYLLLLAEPHQIASVSYLSRHPLESALWKRARKLHGNRGSLEDVIARRPTLVLTMGGGSGRASLLLARRLSLATIDLPAPATPADVGHNLRLVGAALGTSQRAQFWVARLEQLGKTMPRRSRDTVWVSGGGLSLAPDSIGARWLRLAGLKQRRLPEGRVTLETLLTSPPEVLLESNYRSGQMSGGRAWLSHPLVHRAKRKRLVTDGRPWTCMGPLMIPEIERLRAAAR